VPGPAAAPLTTGVTVPYSEEFRVRETNQALIQALASVQPRGGEPGQITAPLDSQLSEELIDADAFRGGLALARSIRDAWPWFVLAGCCLFLGDVFVRRVAINLDWVGKAVKKIGGTTSEKDAAVTARLDALKKQKESRDDSLERRRASVRFEPTAVDRQHESVELTDTPSGTVEKPTTPSSTESQPEGPSYTERLLEAKRRAKK
jgi:hypothetical protein